MNKPAQVPPLASQGCSEQKQAASAAERLSQLIACKTVSIESGGERKEFERMQLLLSEFYPQIFKSMDLVRIRELTLVLRWQGLNQGRPPIVLMAHQDVVEASGSWKYPPFAGVIEDGCVWGRGAIDDKGCLCALLEAVESLLTEGFVPERDIYLVMSHNEEPMGDGAAEVTNWLREQGIEPVMVLDEGGAVVDKVLPGVRGLTAMIGTGEKGYLNVRFKAASRGGHASTPPKSSPLGRLASLINHIEKKPPFPARLNPVIRDLFRRMAPQMSGQLKFVFGNLWLTAPILPRLLASMGGEARALVMTTCAFTMARGSGAPNVLPETAEVTANLRIAVHQSTQEVMDQLQLIAAKYDVECEKIYGHEPTAGGLLDSREAEILIEAIGKIYKNVNVAPYLMLAASDSHHFSSLARNVFKFTPFHLTSDLRGGIHGLDEKLPIDELERAIEFYKTLIRLVPSS